LGYKAESAREAVTQAQSEQPGLDNTGAILKAALKLLLK
jgi:Holliday junction resolvasome RuvABC DNA-binding subunit